jgi:hypothetical protein
MYNVVMEDYQRASIRARLACCTSCRRYHVYYNKAVFLARNRMLGRKRLGRLMKYGHRQVV